MADNRITGPSSANAAAVAEAARRAAAEQARRAAEAAARQAAQAAAQRAPGTGTLPDQQAVSSDASLERNTGPLVGGIAQAPELPGFNDDFAPPQAPQESDEPTGGAGAPSGPPAPNGLQVVEGGIRDVTNPLGGFRGNFAQQSGEVLQAARGPQNLTPEQKAFVADLEARKTRADAANNLLGIATGVVDVGRGFGALQDGQTVEGVAQIAEGGLDVVGRSIRLNSDIREIGNFASNEGIDLSARDRLGSAVTGAADIAAGVGGIASGIESFQDGQIVDGAIELVGGVADTTAGASSIAANLTANGAISRGSGLANFGGRAPTFAGVAGVVGGAVAVSRGVDAIRDGRILEGSVTIATGTLGSAAGAAGAINSFQGIANGANAVTSIGGNVAKFAKLGNQFGGAAAIIGGGFQAFNALSADPPDLKSAAVGGANIVGGALLMTAPSPSAAVGGAILIGTALYENVAPVADLVDAQIGAAINVGQGVVEGAGEVAEGFIDAAGELAEGDVIGAAGAAVGGVARGAGEVLEGLSEGVSRLREGLGDAAASIGRGIAGAGRAVGNFVSSL